MLGRFLLLPHEVAQELLGALNVSAYLRAGEQIRAGRYGMPG